MTIAEWIFTTMGCLPLLFIVLCFFRPFRVWMGGGSKYSRCWMGQHRWSMPGGWCERCGMCDRFFGGHESCGRVCCYYKKDQ